MSRLSLRSAALLAVLSVCAIATAPSARRRIEANAFRTVEGRLPGHAYLPLASITRGNPAIIPLEAVRLLLEVREAERKHPPIDQQAAAHLALGQVDAAIELIEDVPAQQRSAATFTVLSAARLERARRDDDAEAAAAAADAAERAIRIDPAVTEAWFNRAAALERLGLGGSADAWSAYLERDSVSPWAAEAATRQAALAQSPTNAGSVLLRSIADGRPIADADVARLLHMQSDRARELIEDHLLVGWARAVLLGDAERQKRFLETAKQVAEALNGRYQDRTMADLVGDVERTSGDRQAAVAQGVVQALEARSAIDRGEIDRATSHLASARAQLAGLPTAREGVDLYEQFVSYYRGDYRRARPMLQSLAERAAARQHLYIAGRSRLILAAIATREASFSEADALYQECLQLFDAAGEASYLASSEAIVATLRREQGDDRAAWQYLRQALARLPLISNPRHVYSIVTSGMTVSLGTEMSGLAVHFARLLVATSRGWNNPVAVVSALSDEADQRLRFGDTSGARQRLDEARAALVAVTDGQVRPVAAAQLARTEARILSATRPCDAVALYSAAIDTMGHVAPYQMAKLFLGRGLAHRACGTLAAAEQDLRAGIRVFEAQRSGQREIFLQISHFDEVWDLYGQLVRLLAVERGALESALDVAEQSRARSLLDAIGHHQGSLPIASLRVALDPQTTVLSYIMLDDDVLVWAITRDSIRFHRSAARSDEVRLAIQRWRTRVQAGDDDKPLAGRLFEMLVRPLESAITENGRLIVVGDGPLHGVAFAALWDGHRYLVERTAVWTAPSLHWLWSALQPRAGSSAMHGSILAVGDPEFPQRQFPRLLRLPGAAREAARVALPYRRHSTLIGPAATKAAILEGLQAADVVHLAAHAVPDLVDPESSYIVAAADLSPGRAILTAKTIASLAPLPTRLVVLSACQTAAGRVARGEGVLSLARAFMGAGIPTIVGNLWDVSDSSSYSLHVSFHQAWARGQTAASALRSSQLQLLKGASSEDRKPRVWAAVVGLGSPHTAIGDTSAATETSTAGASAPAGSARD